MPDREIPFFNMILRCDCYEGSAPAELPAGYTFSAYRPGLETDWARLEHAIGDFSSPEEAGAYFANTYLTEPEALQKRAVFVLDASGEAVGSCIAWKDPRGDGEVSSLHWLVVSPAHRGQGLGRALCRRVMELFAARNELPVYIHTQPWSWKAVLLYCSLGFCLEKTDSFASYENQYGEAMEALKQILSEEQYRHLRERSREMLPAEEI